MALLRKFHSRPVGQEGEHPFRSGSSDVYTKKIYTYILTVGAHISGPHFETQSCFTSLANEGCFVYTFVLFNLGAR